MTSQDQRNDYSETFVTLFITALNSKMQRDYGNTWPEWGIWLNNLAHAISRDALTDLQPSDPEASTRPSEAPTSPSDIEKRLDELLKAIDPQIDIDGRALFAEENVPPKAKQALYALITDIAEAALPEKLERRNQVVYADGYNQAIDDMEARLTKLTKRGSV